MSVCLIALNNRPVVCLDDIRETWQCIFANPVLRVIGSEATNLFQDDQLSTCYVFLWHWSCPSNQTPQSGLF